MTKQGMHVLISGANKGLGFETARQMAQQGYTVWLGSRDEARGLAAVQALGEAGDVRLLSLDVTDAGSVSRAAARLTQEIDALDVLINNAGTAVADGEGRPSEVQLDTIRATFEVNFYGALRMAQAFLPLLRRADSAHIVNVSSTLGSLGVLTTEESVLAQFPAFAYPASKTLLNTLTGWLAVELRDTAITVNSVCPGQNATDMNSSPDAQPASEGAKAVVAAATLGPGGPTGAFVDASGPVPW